MRLPDLVGRRVAVWGYGREGRAALRILRRVLPGQDFSLICTAAERDVALADAGGAPLDIVTASPDAAVLGAFDVIVKSPGISAYTPALLAAQQSGARVTSGTALWFGEHPQARVIGVTATKGKSTTSALIAHGLRALGRVTALAGNIGLPLLDLLDPPRAPVWWVVELSSFQTREAGPLAVGVVGNLYEEHLDWHGTRERYWDDKLALADRAATLLVNAQQTELLERTAAHPRRLLFGAAPGWHLRDGAICRGGQRVLALAQLPCPACTMRSMPVPRWPPSRRRARTPRPPRRPSPGSGRCRTACRPWASRPGVPGSTTPSPPRRRRRWKPCTAWAGAR